VAISFRKFFEIIKKMRSSRSQKARAQDDTFCVRRDPHFLKKRGCRMTDERNTFDGVFMTE